MIEQPSADELDPADPGDLEPSKSQRKREADEIRDFARVLTTLSPSKLNNLPLPANIADAIKQCPPASTRGAHKRHLQFISKLLRKSGNVSELIECLENPAAGKIRDTTHETMREKLLEALPDHVEELRQNYPTAELQKVRQLVRQANTQIEITAEAEPNPGTIAINKKATKAKAALLTLLKQNALVPADDE